MRISTPVVQTVPGLRQKVSVPGMLMDEAEWEQVESELEYYSLPLESLVLDSCTLSPVNWQKKCFE